MIVNDISVVAYELRWEPIDDEYADCSMFGALTSAGLCGMRLDYSDNRKLRIEVRVTEEPKYVAWEIKAMANARTENTQG